jgi:hypothetical protein
MAVNPKQGSVILLPLSNREWSYVHYIGWGIYGDAFRVLAGTYLDPLPAEEVKKLALKQERFIAQTFAVDLSRIPDAEVVAMVDWADSSTTMSWWVSSPSPSRPEDRWVISIDRELQFRMPEFRSRYPDVDPVNLPETTVLGEGLFLEIVQSDWEPSYGDFVQWKRARGLI